MKLYNIDAQGRFLGVFINHAAGFSCQNTPYDLEGRVWRDHSGIRRCVEKLGDGLQIHDCVARPRVWSYDLDAVGALRP